LGGLTARASRRAGPPVKSGAVLLTLDREPDRPGDPRQEADNRSRPFDPHWASWELQSSKGRPLDIGHGRAAKRGPMRMRKYCGRQALAIESARIRSEELRPQPRVHRRRMKKHSSMSRPDRPKRPRRSFKRQRHAVEARSSCLKMAENRRRADDKGRFAAQGTGICGRSRKGYDSRDRPGRWALWPSAKQAGWRWKRPRERPVARVGGGGEERRPL